jgi:putative hydrolase of the HAD superfamily
VTPAPSHIAAVCFDLDDTLYPQSDWLHGAWATVAARAAHDGVNEQAMRRALEEITSEGSDRGRIIDRALERLGAPHVPVAPLVDAFRRYDAHVLEPFPGVRAGLTRLAAHVPLGLVSDGDPMIQRSKLAALGLVDAFHVVVWSDKHGRRHRKPDPLPFRRAVDLLGVGADETVFVGDRPDKDVAGATAAGLVAIRVRTGEWVGHADPDEAWASVANVAEAIDLVAGVLEGAAERGARHVGPGVRGQASSTPASTRKSRKPGASR